MPLIETSDGLIDYLDWGSGDETVILVHAAQSSPRALTGLANALARPGRRIVAPALCGYGATTVQNVDPVHTNVGIVQAVLDAVGGSRRVLFGHSMGGLVSLLACMQGAQPDFLALYEPIVLELLDTGDTDDMGALAWDRDIVARMNERLAAGDAEGGVRIFIEAWNEVQWDKLPAAIRARLVADADLLRRETEIVSQLRLNRSAIQALAIPTVILQGGASPKVTHRMTCRLANLLPSARRVTIPGAGHMGPPLSPQAVAEALAPALNGI
jgi:pimeloyl-ACP methyl ester carboxylesterase